MNTSEVTLDYLTDALRQSAGLDDAVPLDTDALDVSFRDLGYDSVALLETFARIEREQGIELGDSAIETAPTPRTLLAVINQQLAGHGHRRQVEHCVTVDAPADVIHGLLVEFSDWPRIFPDVVHVEWIEQIGSTERLSMWTAADGKPVRWTLCRVVEASGRRIEFLREESTPPVAGLGGSWLIEPVSPSRSLVRLVHTYRAVDDDPDGLASIAAAVERSSEAELSALKSAAETPPDEVAAILLSFDDSVVVNGSMQDVYDYLNEAHLWAERLSHVDRIDVVEETPGLQLLRMDTHIKDGSPHTTTSVRVCLPPDRIVYKQIGLPKPLTLHSGYWHLTEDDGRVTATSHHTAVLNRTHIPVMLGPDATVADARAFIREALGANSLATLGHAKEYAERRR